MKPVHPKDSAAPLGPYSPGMDTGDLVFFSGQIALDANGNFQNDSLEAELIQIFKNIDALLEAANLEKTNIAKTTIFLSSMDDFTAVNEKYAEYMGEHKPARSTIEVAKLPLSARVEIETIAKR